MGPNIWTFNGGLESAHAFTCELLIAPRHCEEPYLCTTTIIINEYVHAQSALKITAGRHPHRHPCVQIPLLRNVSPPIVTLNVSPPIVALNVSPPIVTLNTIPPIFTLNVSPTILTISISPTILTISISPPILTLR